MTNFASVLASAAADAPEKPATKLDDVVICYAAQDTGAQRIAGMLQAWGVQPGDRVGMQLPNVPYFPLIYFGILRAGAVVVPMNPLLKGREVAYHLSDAGARIHFAWHGFAEHAEAGAGDVGAECILVRPGEFEPLVGAAEPLVDIAERAHGDPAVIIYTSGTTGVPKGATLTHGNLHAAARASQELVAADDGLVMLGMIPLFHVFGMNSVMNACIRARGLMTLLPRFDPAKALDIIQRDGVTSFAAVPTMYSALLHQPGREAVDLSSLHLCVSGGAALPVEVLHGFDTAFGATVLEGYGLSETTGMATFNLPGRERKPGSIGLPVGGTEVRIIDDGGCEVPGGERGEIVLRGPTVMKDYWGRPEATTEAMPDGWLRTGDIGFADDDGYLFVVDRKKELIIRGGYNVYPREIEEVLYTHPAVREAAVVGVPHVSLGEEVAAAVALADDAEVSPDDLIAYVQQRVAAYKYPRLIWIVDELPKGQTGKILKREITVPDGLGAR